MASTILLAFFLFASVSVAFPSPSPSPSPSPCLQTDPLLFAFGDSNSDTGNNIIIYGTIPDFPEGRTFFHQPSGRACDGRLIIDFFCESLGVNYLTPYFKIFSPDYSNGANFAIAGAATIRSDANPGSLRNEIAEFSLFRNISLRCNLISADQFSRALYLVDIGQNDIDRHIDVRPIDSLVPEVVSNIKQAIQTVYALGGRNFWVHNTGPVGCLPRNVANRSSSPVDAYGCVAARNEAAATFNAGLKRMCQKLRLEMADAVIVYVDVFSIKLDLIANATSYGFENPFSRCVDKDTDPNKTTVCAEPEEKTLISWDGLHYTEAANALVAAKIISGNFSTPPLPFNFFCN